MQKYIECDGKCKLEFRPYEGVSCDWQALEEKLPAFREEYEYRVTELREIGVVFDGDGLVIFASKRSPVPVPAGCHVVKFREVLS